MTSLRGRCSVVLAAVLCLAADCSRSSDRGEDVSFSQTTTASLPARLAGDTPTPGTDDRQWIMPARNFASTRYSGLSHITTENVGQLQLAWSFSTGVTRGHEAAPLVVGSTRPVLQSSPVQ